MNVKLRLRTIELRYALTQYLFQHGPTTVADLIDALDYQGFDIPGRASKSVSDALRSDLATGRVRRLNAGFTVQARCRARPSTGFTCESWLCARKPP